MLQWTAHFEFIWCVPKSKHHLPNRWSKAFLESGKNGLTRSVLRDATTDEVKTLKHENADLKRAVAELTLDVMKYKKSLGM